MTLPALLIFAPQAVWFAMLLASLWLDCLDARIVTLAAVLGNASIATGVYLSIS